MDTSSKSLTGDADGIRAFIDRFDVILLDCDGDWLSFLHSFDFRCLSDERRCPLVRRTHLRRHSRNFGYVEESRYHYWQKSIFRGHSTIDDLYKGKQVIFVTNNSTKSRVDYQQKLTAMGVAASAVCL